MAKWEIKCYTFHEVRELIDEGIESSETCIEIMEILADCCNEIARSRENWDFYDDFIEMRDEINEELEYMCETDDYDDLESKVNFMLHEMYDLCDAARVWLA